MIQAESGGQQFNPQGGVLTSPKGALGVAQVMPETGANPGYGIPPATPQELATEAAILSLVPDSETPCKDNNKECNKRWMESLSDCV